MLNLLLLHDKWEMVNKHHMSLHFTNVPVIVAVVVVSWDSIIKNYETQGPKLSFN